MAWTSSDQQFALATATAHVRRMTELETRCWGDEVNALCRVSEMVGLSYRSLRYLKLGYRKTISGELAERIRQSYLTYVSRQIALPQLELERGKAAEANAANQDIAAETAALAAEVQARIKRGR